MTTVRQAGPERRGQDIVQSAVLLDGVALTLTSRAGPIRVLDEVDLDVPAGQSVAIVGPSGSGKTSLLMILAGLERATTGGVIVAGHDLSRMSEDELALLRGREIGIVFQSFHLVPTMTALENVALPLEFAGDRDAFKTARMLLGEVGLERRVDHFPAELSGGEQQRVALARALSRRPALLLADEPTGNLDGATGRQIVEMLFDLHRRHGTTLILVTHDEQLAARCGRILRMADGRIVADSTTEASAGAEKRALAGDGTAGA
ncbi:MAG: ABC transporter ATP-binding protein [Hyphomicrobiaceae bacterium]